jgi:butyryl-CoA dehydrogenase
MDFMLDDEQKMIRDLAREIAEEKVVPVRAELDEKEEFPWDIMKILADSDIFRLIVPEEYGGLGKRVVEFGLVVEELSRACAGVSISYAATGLGLLPLTLFGTHEQKSKYMADIADGKKLAAFGLTEASAGSDASNMQTTAKKDGDHYVINGTKQWITNAGEAEMYIIIAMTDKNKGTRGASAFIVDKGMEGFSFGKKEKKMGIRASTTGELILENVKVPVENMVGREGAGFIIALKTLDMSRPAVGAQAVGIAQGAMEAALDFASDRIQFGQPVVSFQAVQHMLADMGMQIEAARALVRNTAMLIDSGETNFTKYSAMAKCFASDVAMKVTTDAVQICGGSGYMRDYPVEKMMRDAKITQIYEGTNQIQRNVIANAMIKERAANKKSV